MVPWKIWADFIGFVFHVPNVQYIVLFCLCFSACTWAGWVWLSDCCNIEPAALQKHSGCRKSKGREQIIQNMPKIAQQTFFLLHCMISITFKEVDFFINILLNFLETKNIFYIVSSYSRGFLVSQLTWPSLNSWRTKKLWCTLQQHLLLCRGVTKVGERVQCLTRLLCSESYETFHCSRVRCHLSFNGKVTVTCRDLAAKRTDVTVKLNENAPWKQLTVIAGAGFIWKLPSMKSWHKMPSQILHQSFFLILQSDNFL